MNVRHHTYCQLLTAAGSTGCPLVQLMWVMSLVNWVSIRAAIVCLAQYRLASGMTVRWWHGGDLSAWFGRQYRWRWRLFRVLVTFCIVKFCHKQCTTVYHCQWYTYSPLGSISSCNCHNKGLISYGQRNNSRHVPQPRLLSSTGILVPVKPGKYTDNYLTQWPSVRGFAASSGVWQRALNWRSAPHQRALAHQWLHFLLRMLLTSAVSSGYPQ